MKSNEQFQDEQSVVVFIQELISKINSVSIENYSGFYDNLNIQNFLDDFNSLSDYYPNPAFRLLRSNLTNWINWRDQQLHHNQNKYYIYQQEITDHAFCECAERIINYQDNTYSILNHHGHNLGNSIPISKANQNISIASLFSIEEIMEWFSKERIPKRNFHIIDKHGENRMEEKTINGELVSPLKCSKAEAQEMLNQAIGDNIEELYNLDSTCNNFIVFKFEGENPQNMYHGFHLPTNSLEIPQHIKTILEQRNALN